jgi:hypothetical protein
LTYPAAFDTAAARTEVVMGVRTWRIVARRGWVVFGCLAVLGLGQAEARPVDPTATPYIALGDFEDTFGQAFGKVDKTIVGYFDLLQRFTGARLLELPGAQRVGQFDTFIREAQSSLDSIPIPSGSASVAYTYDPKLETFVRWERPLTPSLSQNAYTSGKGVLTVGASYSYINYKRFDEQPNDNTIFVIGTGLSVGDAGNIVQAQYLNFKLKENVVGVSLQYGLLDNLDFGVFIPIVDLDFKARSASMFVGELPNGEFLTLQGRIVPQITDLTEDDFAKLPPELRLPGIAYKKQKTDVGDIVLRTKMFFATLKGFDTGGQVNVSVPTGDSDNLIGTGSTRVDPRLLVSSSSSKYSAHVNVGPHIDTDDSDLDRFDYTAGGEVQFGEHVTMLLDQVGRIEYSGDKIKKFEIVPGIKVRLIGNVVVGFNAIVPLVHEGLTTDFTPNVATDISYVF